MKTACVILHSIQCNNNNDNNNNNNDNCNHKNCKNNSFVFWFFIFNFAIFWFYFFISREECQPMHVKFIYLLKGELTVKLERFNLEF